MAKVLQYLSQKNLNNRFIVNKGDKYECNFLTYNLEVQAFVLIISSFLITEKIWMLPSLNILEKVIVISSVEIGQKIRIDSRFNII